MARSSGIRLGHVNLEVTDLQSARRFYDRFFPVLGFSLILPVDRFWVGYRKGHTAIWLTATRPGRVVRRAPHVPIDGNKDPISDHLGFQAPSVRRVLEVERSLRRLGFRPVYSTDRQRTKGPTWYTSNAWRDPDNNVLEVYAVTRR
jgi:catechol 2,3-dioxygenase-like lactoylglutathione lyase family enzyme